MKKKLLVTVGIPAYNEEENIQFLLKSLLRQKLQKTILNEIIVISDGSTDRTVDEVKLVNDKRIKVFHRTRRLGISKTQNELLSQISGDILVMLDGDVLPENEDFLEEIIKPIIKNKRVGLVSGDIISAQPEGVIESIISYSTKIKKYITNNLSKKHNIYLCHGRVRAFSKELYTKLRWDENVPEDAFSYLFCISKGYRFVSNPKAKVIFRSPTTISDHAKQSNRFEHGKEILKKHFPKELVRSEYTIPFLLIVKAFGIYVLKNPGYVFGYILITFYIRAFEAFDIEHSVHDVAKSSKRIKIIWV